MGIVDGSYPCPSRFLSDTAGRISTEVNPTYTTWIVKDQNLLSWINATLSEVVPAYIVRLQTSQEFWEDLKKRNASLARSHVIQLKQLLQNVRKEAVFMQDYLQQVKILADKLSACGASVDENDLILSLVELHTLLICEELNLGDTQHPSSATTKSTAAFSVICGRGRGHLHSRGRGRHGYGRENSSFPQNQQEQKSGTFRFISCRNPIKPIL